MRINIVIISWLLAAAPALAYDGMYPAGEIRRDSPRLANAVRKIYEIGIKPLLTPQERRGLGNIVFEFPMPDAQSDILNFYAYRSVRQNHVVMPVLSLKQLEDLATAYAWLHARNYSLSTIDLYFAMLRHKPEEIWPHAKVPDILSALGVPKLAYKEPGVDSTSLALRNEAFAFIIAHELAHILFRHQPYAKITTAQSRDDELQADRFALGILAKTNTSPMGAVLFFQAQVYRMSHRGDFDSDAAWQRYIKTSATHPLSYNRIKQIATFTATVFSQVRKSEARIWRFIGAKVGNIAEVLEDTGIQRCISKTAFAAAPAQLKPKRAMVGLEACR